jgi:hypothetical protein
MAIFSTSKKMLRILSIRITPKALVKKHSKRKISSPNYFKNETINSINSGAPRSL